MSPGRQTAFTLHQKHWRSEENLKFNQQSGSSGLCLSLGIASGYVLTYGNYPFLTRIFNHPPETADLHGQLAFPSLSPGYSPCT